MATMKFAFVSLTLFVLLEAHNARELNDVSIKGSFDGRPLFQEVVIQMVIGEELRLPQSPPSTSSYDQQTIYGRINPSPPPPNVAPSKGQETFGRVNPSPPPPIVAPSKGQETFGRVKSSPPPPIVAPSKGQETFGRVKSSPPPPIVAPSKVQETFGRIKSSPPPPIVAPSKGQETYGIVNSPPPPPDRAPSQGHTFYDVDKQSSNSQPTDGEAGDAAIEERNPTHLLLSDGRKNLCPPQAPAFSSKTLIAKGLPLTGYISSYFARVFKY